VGGVEFRRLQVRSHNLCGVGPPMIERLSPERSRRNVLLMVPLPALCVFLRTINNGGALLAPGRSDQEVTVCWFQCLRA
jgi:hypothetical protein